MTTTATSSSATTQLDVPIKVVGTGIYVPPRVETAAQVAERAGCEVSFVAEDMGVERRHITEISLEEMAAHAAREALGDGGPPDLIVNGSASIRQFIPDTSVFVSEQLGLDGVPSFTVHATCLSFLVSLQVAASQMALGLSRRTLIVSSEKASGGRDFDSPECAALFGDGAAAAVLEPTPAEESSRLLAWTMETHPAAAHLTEVRAGQVGRHPLDPETRPEDYLFDMNGPAILKATVRPLRAAVQRVLELAGLESADELGLIVPHQASAQAFGLFEWCGLPADRTVNIIAEHGNCVAASIPMALAIANAEGRVSRGDKVLLLGTGAGLSVAAAVLRW